jgi:hypothetical protein
MRYFLAAYFQKKDGRYDEFADFKDELTPALVEVNNVILDLKSQKVIKGEVGMGKENKNFKQLYTYYKQQYPEQIK